MNSSLQKHKVVSSFIPDWDMIKIAFLNNIFSEIVKEEVNKLKAKYTNMYISFREYRHPQYGIKAHQQKEADSFAKQSLRWLLDNEYFEIEKENDLMMCYPTQKLYDADPIPVGGYTKKARVKNEN